MRANEPIAHVADDGRIHLLQDHLSGTAERAAQFAAEFGAGGWGRLAGLWHDLGKFSPAFQKKIRAAAQGHEAHLEAKARVDHSTAGALYASQQFSILGRILAYITAGHHAGLPDWHADETGRKALSQRLLQTALLDEAVTDGIPQNILDQAMPTEKPKPGTDPALWIRMLFSCLVDADFLDTETFFAPEKAAIRSAYLPLHELLALFDDFMEDKLKSAPDTEVNKARAGVLGQCIRKSSSSPGIFTLTVPTGGGKTLSSMAFALRHAVQYGKRRIIYVIPYTSIIEQTADQFRAIFGDAVVEHHSNIDTTDELKETSCSRLACENWDAPIIITTSVQFFESLFASRPSRCRKLHNIGNSVVVLDETQLLPPEFLKPILNALQELQKNYGVTLLLSTATQPALGKREGFEGLTGIMEIIDDPISLHQALKRVDIVVPENLSEPQTWETVAAQLERHDAVLCILNRRDDARQLWSLMPERTVHLSGLMCGQHRSRKIREIKEKLAANEKIRVVSTQLVEAGVDLDFPVVYRALAGLDSIAQAAGRCNREGLRSTGEVVVFVPPKEPPIGLLRQTAVIGKQILAQPCVDQLHPDRFTEFFRQFYWLQGEQLDKHRIMDDLSADPELRFAFRAAASKFHLIDEAKQQPVIVRYEKSSEYISQLEKKGPERRLMRSLQRYMVNLPRYLHHKLVASGAIHELYPGIFVQTHTAIYDDELGFCADRSMIYNPDDLVG